MKKIEPNCSDCLYSRDLDYRDNCEICEMGSCIMCRNFKPCENYKPRVFVLLLGKSGSGKTTVAKLLADEGYPFVRPYNTRPIRKNEDITTYHFISEKEYAEIKEKFAETEFDGYKRCTNLNELQISDLYIVDPNGITSFDEEYDGARNIVSVYLDASEKTLADRMAKREDTKENIERRIKNDREVFKDIYEKVDISINTEFFDAQQVASLVKHIITGGMYNED